MTPKEKVSTIIRTLDAKKAADIRLLDLGGLSILADYFIIASGSSSTQVKALSDEVEKALSAQGEEPKRIEGYPSASWILLDYGDILIHIFYKETREFYDLERLWKDAKELDVNEYLEKHSG